MDPLTEYAARLAAWNKRKAIEERRFIVIGNWRLTLGILEAVLAVLVFGPDVVPVWTLIVPVAAFIPLAIWHSRVNRRRVLANRAIAYYNQRVDRVEDRWIASGSTGQQFSNPDHVYAEDLDVFGKGSLFQLISSARTSAGERTLAEWLLSPAPRVQAVARQSAVRELAPRIDLREDIALLGEDIQAEVQVAALTAWGAQPLVSFPPLLRPFGVLLAIAGIAAPIAFFAHLSSIWPLAAILAVDFAIIAALRERVNRVLEAVDMPARGLRLLALMMNRLEKERFTTPRLQELESALHIAGAPASARIARLQRWIDWLESSDHMLIRAIRALLLFPQQIAMGLEAWRRENGRYVGAWLGAIAEFEALSSLAALAFERPHWTFPEYAESSEPLFDAQALQHPLIAPARCVPNDISIGGPARLLIVSGSNMSGKSTLLRAVGLNSILAWAGAPVAAQRLLVSELQVGASIRITDSLQDNRSRFYAEIIRLRKIVDLAKEHHNLIFLLDELLSGTNSHDRRIGAAGIVQKLVELGAIGLITTHDLALAEIERDLEGSAINVHFEDRIREGEIEFDYRLRPGVVTHSNALELMRTVGLDV